MKRYSVFNIFVLLLLPTGVMVAQEIPSFLKSPQYRSDRAYEKKATTDGNRVNITFFNTGLLGGTGEVRGEWPRGSEQFYVGDVLPVVGLEVPVKRAGKPDTLVQHTLTVRGPRAGSSVRPGQTKFWGFEPMAGFANPEQTNSRPAINIDKTTWPTTWPDQPTWLDGQGKPQWNGFFGRGIENADFESYFWMDDNNDDFMNRQYQFKPDSVDGTRGGQGLAMKVRVLQWSQFLAQDAAFFVYELTNTSTTTYPRVAVGLTVGTLAGGDGDSQDDLAFFDQANRIVYSWDNDNSDFRNRAVGYAGYAFMESPGNHLDGIDNDGDADPAKLNPDGVPFVNSSIAGTQNTFTADDFLPRVLAVGDPLVLIDARTNARTTVYMTAGVNTVVSQGISYSLSPGQSIQERTEIIRGQIDQITVTTKDLIDNDLDGVVDEDVNLHFTRRAQNFVGQIITLPALRYKNFVGFAKATQSRAATAQDSIDFGLRNPMIDETGFDGVDNDGDWNPLVHDVGSDGKGGTGDAGEGDGRPNAGEPNFDALDVDETDQVGLSSFYYFTPPGALRMDDDRVMWNSMTPGFFTTNAELSGQQSGGGVDGDFIFSSGYFKLAPGETMRFSLALVFGRDLQSITNNVQTVQEIYNRNYNFARPPEKPTLKAVSGDKKVLLYWDNTSELSVDPVLGFDFEGYKLLRSTDPSFLDPDRITDAFGNTALIKPLMQWDVKNSISGIWQPYKNTGSPTVPVWEVNSDLLQRTRGVPFYLGNNSDLVHSFLDTTVTNGQDYYYALVAYDRGDINFYPAENNFSVTVTDAGQVRTDINVAKVRPNAAVPGYVSGGVSGTVTHPTGNATGSIFIEVLDPMKVPQNKNYAITFNEAGAQATTFNVTSNGSTVVNARNITAYESVIFDGMRAIMMNDANRLNYPDIGVTRSWADTTGLKSVRLFQNQIEAGAWNLVSVPQPFDYEIQFHSSNVSTTTATTLGTGSQRPTTSSVASNIRIINKTSNIEVPFAIHNPAAPANLSSRRDTDGRLSVGELLYILQPVDAGYVVAYAFRYNNSVGTPDATIRQTADQVLAAAPSRSPLLYNVFTKKSFRTNDEFRFTSEASKVDGANADEILSKINVVPNPYLAAASWESKLPPTIQSGRGERRVDFVHIPAGSTIRIFSVRGDLVKELKHTSTIDNGTVTWDLRTKENLEVAFGVYFYHVQAPGVGEKTGKLALIK